MYVRYFTDTIIRSRSKSPKRRERSQSPEKPADGNPGNESPPPKEDDQE